MNTRLPVSLLGAAGLYASLLTFAADTTAPDVAELIKSGDIMSQEAIIKHATAQHPGRVTEAELEREGGRYVYEIDIVDDKGEKTELKLDAKSGDLLSSKIDDEGQPKNDSENDEEDDD